MYLLQVDSGVVTGTLDAAAVPDGGGRGMPPGRSFVVVAEEDPHRGDPLHWSGGTVSDVREDGTFTFTPPA